MSEEQDNEAQLSEDERRCGERVRPRGGSVIYKKTGLLSGLLGKKAGANPVPVRNVCSTGLCLLCREKLKNGQQLQMVLRFGGRKHAVQVLGKVVWCGEGSGAYPYQAGVQFVDYRGDSWRVLSHLRDHVAEREPSSETMRLRRRSTPSSDASQDSGDDSEG